MLSPRALMHTRHFAPSVAVTLSVVAAATTSGSPTGSPLIDLAARTALAVGFVIVTLRAGRVARVGAALVLALAALADPAALPLAVAYGALGLALGDLALGASGPASASLIGFGLGFVALRLPGATTGSSAAVVTAAFVILGSSIAMRASTATRRRVLWTAAGLGVAVVGATLVLATSALVARARVEDGMADTRVALDASRDGNTEQAAIAFANAERSFAAAHNLVAGWWTEPARFIPIVGHYRVAASELTAGGVDLAATGARLARSSNPNVSMTEGRVSIDAVRALEPPLAEAVAALDRTADRLAGLKTTWLMPPIANQIDELEQRVARGLDETTTGLEAVRVLPAVLGGEGDRRYFVAFQTPAEQRAGGGIIGNYAIVTFANGAFDLASRGRDTDLNTQGMPVRTLRGPADYVRRYRTFQPERTWQNVTMSPDFPSVAQVIEDLAPQSGAGSVDGVVTIDPRAVAALLQLTGPISVPNLAFPLSAANAEQFLLHDQYSNFTSNGARIDFLGDTIDALVDRMRTATLPPPARIAQILGPVVREGRIAMHSTRPAEQRLFALTGADGALPAVDGDFAGLVTQNASGNKIDMFQRRALHYKAVVDPATGHVDATAKITLHNDAPRTGLPHYVIGGSGANPTADGDSRVYVSFYSPLALRSARIGNTPLVMQGGAELERNVYSAMVLVPAKSSLTLTLELAGTVAAPAADRDGYALTLWRQPTIKPDGVEIDIRAKNGALAPGSGLRPSAGGLRGAGHPAVTTQYVAHGVR
jgi:hypothetical protein